MQKQCTVDLWTAGYAGSRLTASARSPMDKPWTTLCVAHRLPTGRRLPTSSTVLKPIVIKSGKVKTKTPAPALAYSSPVAVQTTGTTAPDADRRPPHQGAVELDADRRTVLLLRRSRLRCRLFRRRWLGCPQVHVEDAGRSEGAGRGFPAVPLFRRKQGRLRQRPVHQRFRGGADQGGTLLLRDQQSVRAVLPERLPQAERLTGSEAATRWPPPKTA